MNHSFIEKLGSFSSRETPPKPRRLYRYIYIYIGIYIYTLYMLAVSKSSEARVRQALEDTALSKCTHSENTPNKYTRTNPTFIE